MRNKTLLLITILSATLSCQSVHQFFFGIHFHDSFSGVPFEFDGWVDDDTFHSTVKGLAEKSISDRRERRSSARKDAVRKAIMLTLEEFSQNRYDFNCGKIAMSVCRNGVNYEFKDFVDKTNVIIREVYDVEDNCECTIEFKMWYLKDKVYR